MPVTVTQRRLAPAGADFYPTPAWGTEALCHYEKFDGPILEPCCGDGAMARVLTQHGYFVIPTDKYCRGYGYQRDFFDVKQRCANIVTNPPFGIAEQIVHHALNLATRKVAIFGRTAFLESVRRYESIYKDIPPSRVLIFTRRISLYADGEKGSMGGGTTSFAWFIWDVADIGKPTTIQWIDPRFGKSA
jgi:hypothetical protein